MTQQDQPKIAPLPTIRRLPTYLRLLRKYHAHGATQISGTTIAEELAVESIVVRKDLGYTGIVGRPAVGFDIADAICKIENFLGWNNTTDAFLIGAGALGTALMGYEGFTRHGMNIVAAFDNDPRKVGGTIHGKPVLPMEKLGNLVGRMHVHLSVVTVPAAAAQAVADTLVAAGVLAIWNFAPTTLKVPKGIIVQNAELSAELAVLSVTLANLKRTQLLQKNSNEDSGGSSSSNDI